jgi:hypothetical protein
VSLLRKGAIVLAAPVALAGCNDITTKVPGTDIVRVADQDGDTDKIHVAAACSPRAVKSVKWVHEAKEFGPQHGLVVAYVACEGER